jgi:hypothetical protein
VTIYAKLSLADVQAGVEINHIAFHQPTEAIDDETAFLAKSLSESRFVVTRENETRTGSEH